MHMRKQRNNYAVVVGGASCIHLRGLRSTSATIPLLLSRSSFPSKLPLICISSAMPVLLFLAGHGRISEADTVTIAATNVKPKREETNDRR